MESDPAVDADAETDTSVEALQPRDLLDLLDLSAPVTRGTILQRAAELAAANVGDAAAERAVRRAGERLAAMAAQTATGTLLLDGEGAAKVPLMDQATAVQDFAATPTVATYPQEVVEGMLNPVRRRVMTTCISIDCTPMATVLPPTPLQLAQGYGVDIVYQSTTPQTKPGFTAGGAYTVDSTTIQEALHPVPSTVVPLLTAGQSTTGPFLGGPTPEGTKPDGQPVGDAPFRTGNPNGGLLPTAALVKQSRIQQAALALGCPAGLPGAYDAETAHCPGNPDGAPTSMVGVPPLATPADHTTTFPARFSQVLSMRLKQFTFPGSVYNIEDESAGVYYTVDSPQPGPLPPGPLYTPSGEVQPGGDSETCDPEIHSAIADPPSFTTYPACPPPSASWDPCALSPGSYTFKSLATAIEAKSGLHLFVASNGRVWFGDPGVAHGDPPTTYVVFPGVCVPIDSKACSAGDIVICQPGGAPPTGYRLASAGGLGPLLGFSHASFAVSGVKVCGTSGLTPPAPATGTRFDRDGLAASTTTTPAQGALPPMDSAKVYISVDDFTHSSYPTFVGQTSEAIMPADIIGEARIPNATVGTTTVVGDHLVTGFPYSSRVYFGPVTVERLRIRVLGTDGTPVDTRGAPFSLVLELEQLYNV